MNDNIKNQLENAGYDYAIAVATKAEVEAGAACGQLAILGTTEQ
jgi:adenine C2-methylase RlmN of 23S rRNA A2503 and tRNA A37